MILHEFPDLKWLKSQIAQGFRNQQGWQNRALKNPGWPNVIIHSKVQQIYRPEIKGPLSIFVNLSGQSFCKVNNHRARIDDQFYFISNQQEHYDLIVDHSKPTETFNIHFGEYFSEEVFFSLVNPADQLLNAPFEKSQSTINFYNKLYPRDAYFNQILQNIALSSQLGSDAELYQEEQLQNLLVYLLQTHRQVLKQVARLPSVKAGTKIEIYRRLSYVLDYIHSHFERNIQLEELAQVACLSKYHFLRLFKMAFRGTPYQYLSQVRLEKAKELLKTTRLPIHQIALLTGFENSSSFSRLFRQKLKVYPSQYRQQV